MLTKIEPKVNSIILIMPIWYHSSMRGMCHRCYSSGVSIALDEESFEAVCDKCSDNSNKKK
ncbi:MAG: hypothetical protein OEM77_03460 [Nitrosopumilus sp.]|nr:hypothetical protein [Nitrosopumilus sp.]MDH3736135.1 hypothetical protein [Nitrosopumilus sp.]MDH3822556.1 hypothetical protein [Nitrosopumilus sp.]MDH3833294.1 hypothetical protein [Nitrosopumilus sp.]